MDHVIDDRMVGRRDEVVKRLFRRTTSERSSIGHVTTFHSSIDDFYRFTTFLFSFVCRLSSIDHRSSHFQTTFSSSAPSLSLSLPFLLLLCLLTTISPTKPTRSTSSSLPTLRLSRTTGSTASCSRVVQTPLLPCALHLQQVTSTHLLPPPLLRRLLHPLAFPIT